VDGALHPDRRGAVERRTWEDLQGELALQLLKGTYELVIQPLRGEWLDDRLAITGPWQALEWAAHRLTPLIQRAAQAEIVFAAPTET
jgi:hypothetical protein